MIQKLRQIGIEAQSNQCTENQDIFYLRLSISECALMECAEDMPLDKKLKPMVIPSLADDNGGVAPVVEGGFIPFSLTRADGYNFENRTKNVEFALRKMLPRVSKTFDRSFSNAHTNIHSPPPTHTHPQ